MMYFKFTDEDGKVGYGVCVNKVRGQIKELWKAKTLEEISKEEYKRGVEQRGEQND